MKTIKMPRKLWKKWDHALRSGEYKQGKGLLCNDHGAYCCLGVLQKVADGDVQRLGHGGSRGLPSTGWLGDHAVRFAHEDGFSSFYTTPYLPALGRRAHVANDSGTPFVEIADAIKDAVEFTD